MSANKGTPRGRPPEPGHRPVVARTILFDFDYTLADSSRGVIDCIDYALRELGLLPVSDEQARRTIGLSLSDTLIHLAGPQPAARCDAFARLFVERADQVMLDKTVLLRAVPRSIEQLRRRGLSLGIVSTKYRRRIEAILRREDLLEAFGVIVGGEDVSAHKPDPEGLLQAIDRLSVSPQDTLYVGDSLTDAETARRASVRFAAVLSGVTPLDAFQGHPVCRVLESVAELPELIA
jgi:phosphoglycolate phosphatase